MDPRHSIRAKLRSVILWTCASVLFLTIGSFVTLELLTFRRSHLENMQTVAELMASTCTSSLAFQDQEDAEAMLSALEAAPSVKLAVLYNEEGRIFAIYPENVTTNQVPQTPGPDRRRYESGKLVIVEPSIQEKRVGTLYLEADLTPLVARLQLYSAIVVLVLLSSFLLALFLSSYLQKRITRPILALASVARKISSARDYRVRAEVQSEDEIGVLTEAFNHMLGQIAERDATLRETAGSLKLALESSQTGTWRWDARTNMVEMDEHVLRLLGLQPGQFAGTYQAFLELVHPEDRPALDHMVATSLQKKSNLAVDFRVKLPNGSTRYISSRGRAMEDSSGAAMGMTGVLLDVTESKQAELALRESEQRFRTLADAAPVMVWTAGATGEWDYVNRGWQEFTGHSPEKDLGFGWQRVVHPEDFGECTSSYQRVVTEREAFDWIFRFQREDGEYRYLRMRGVPRLDPGGRLNGLVGTCLDITEVKQAQSDLERRVEDRTAELAETNRELESFTYSVSHDLRAPLRHINAYAQILQEECGKALTEDAQKYLTRIRLGTKNMGMLVDDLLNLARVGRQELNFEPCDLNAILQEVLSDLRSETEGRQIEWRIGELRNAECDPGLIKQVFANLLSNAVKYTRPRNPAIIEVGQEPAGGEEVIYVRDNGVGFSMQYANKLFGVFQRLHRAEDFEGTGVGLATVERIVRKHGGRIWAEAELDKGAVFYFTLGGDRSTANAEEVKNE